MSKSSHLPWYKRCPSDWQRGTRRHGMSFELRGFYSECLDVMWELQGQLPKDAKTLSMLLGTNPRMVRSLMPKLVDLGKMVESETGYYNPRMMADICGCNESELDGEFTPVSIATQPPVEVESKSNGARVERESSAKIQKNPMITTREVDTDTEVESKIENKNAFSYQEPAPAKPPANVKPVANWRTAFAIPEEHPSVTFDRGKLKLHNGNRADWLARFDGDAESLDLALIQAANYVQPNSLAKPLEVQVNAQLARIANDHRQRRKNLATVKAANAPKSKIASHMQRY